MTVSKKKKKTCEHEVAADRNQTTKYTTHTFSFATEGAPSPSSFFSAFPPLLCLFCGGWALLEASPRREAVSEGSDMVGMGLCMSGVFLFSMWDKGEDAERVGVGKSAGALGKPVPLVVYVQCFFFIFILLYKGVHTGRK